MIYRMPIPAKHCVRFSATDKLQHGTSVLGKFFN